MKKKFLIFVSIMLVVCLMVCLTGCNNTKDTTYDTVKLTKMQNFTHLNEKMVQNEVFDNVVMIGDSIVELYNTQEQFGNVNTLNGERIVLNRGISGDTSDKMLERLDKNALIIKPSTLFILVGTNDVGRGIDNRSIINNIKSAVIKAKNSGVDNIVVESVYPVNHGINGKMVGSRKNSTIIELNKGIKSMTKEENVQYVDVFSHLIDSEGNFNKDLSYDGLHPNEFGYDVISSVLLPYIK